MNPYIVPGTCSICGEEGSAHAGFHGYGDTWLHNFVHQDPMICKENLERQKKLSAYQAVEEWKKQQEQEEGSGI